MMTKDPKSLQGARFAAMAGTCLLLVQLGCGLDEVKVPGLNGPSELALSLKLSATPDVITADGFSTSSIQALARGPNGQPVGGVGITFLITDGLGNRAEIGKLSSGSATTNSAGIAQVIYTAPDRTDNTADRTILITARPITDDASGQLYRSVRLELRNPEPRFFPEVPGDKPPSCSFNVEPGQGGAFPGNQILFKSTSSDIDGFIIRYEWDFGDGSRDFLDKPDVNHAYAFSGAYSVTHVVTDNAGSQASCEKDVVVQ